jgi:hypothetical protein
MSAGTISDCEYARAAAGAARDGVMALAAGRAPNHAENQFLIILLVPLARAGFGRTILHEAKAVWTGLAAPFGTDGEAPSRFCGSGQAKSVVFHAEGV